MTQMISPDAAVATKRYLVVSTDSHVGPSLQHDLRSYCPKQFQSQLDEYVRKIAVAKSDDCDVSELTKDEQRMRALKNGFQANDDDHRGELARAQTVGAAGQRDPVGRLRDMDTDGVAADVVFAGGANGEVLPFIPDGTSAGPPDIPGELRAAGTHMWNQWLADFVSVEPARHVGVMQVPVWDIGLAVQEVTWAANAGLKAVNLPAPRADFASFNEPEYEPFWSACEDAGLPLVTHAGAGGGQPLGITGPGGIGCHLAETHWFAHRALWQLIFGGVFERHPNLKIVFTETGIDWVPFVLRELDSVYRLSTYDDQRAHAKRLPSEYWATNCFLSGSFLAHYEVEMRDEVGLRNLMWGTDYPHMEGTWPHTKLAMRKTFSGIPEDDVRAILGGNALSVFPLDEKALRVVADRIGPTPEELALPLVADEIPTIGGFRAFRDFGTFA